MLYIFPSEIFTQEEDINENLGKLEEITKIIDGKQGILVNVIKEALRDYFYSESSQYL